MGATDTGKEWWFSAAFPSRRPFIPTGCATLPSAIFFEVITHGYGVMYPFGSRITPADRWAIISYIRALQFSQNATTDQIEPTDKTQLEKAK